MSEQQFSFYANSGIIHDESFPTMEDAKAAAMKYYAGRKMTVLVGPVHAISVESCIATDADDILRAMDAAARDNFCDNDDDDVFEIATSREEFEADLAAVILKHVTTSQTYMDPDECEEIAISGEVNDD